MDDATYKRQIAMLQAQKMMADATNYYKSRWASMSDAQRYEAMKRIDYIKQKAAVIARG